MSTTLILSPNPALGAIKESSSSPNMSISTMKEGISIVHASFSTMTLSNLALAATAADLSTLSLGSPSSLTTATHSPQEHGHSLTGPAYSATKGTTALTPRPDISPKNNVGRVNIDITAPKVVRDFESTAQLAICAGLLNKIDKGASSLSFVLCFACIHRDDPSFSSLSVSQRAWILEMEKSPGEKQYFARLTTKMVSQIVSSTLKSSETIREIILLACLLNRELYKTLIDCFLKRLDGSVLFDVNVRLRLVELIKETPKDCLTADDLSRTHGCVRRSVDFSQIGKDELAHLVLDITLIHRLSSGKEFATLSYHERFSMGVYHSATTVNLHSVRDGSLAVSFVDEDTTSENFRTVQSKLQAAK
ncbi:hypothetical protein BGZ83_002472 [Gryganskiella cystojenkinii]|nr:hypothetical protein BGZ83_002472 [Gryganskiella cystojenkinii]